MAIDITTSLNFVFALIIAILGFWVYRAKEISLALYVSIGFALFAISHLELLLGVSSSNISIIVIRVVAYLVIIYGLFRVAMKE